MQIFCNKSVSSASNITCGGLGKLALSSSISYSHSMYTSKLGDEFEGVCGAGRFGLWGTKISLKELPLLSTFREKWCSPRKFGVGIVVDKE